MSHVMTKPVYAICDIKDADQPAHPCSLTSVFDVPCLDCIIPILAISKISRLHLVCSWAGRFESNLVANRKDRFSRDVAQMFLALKCNEVCYTDQKQMTKTDAINDMDCVKRIWYLSPMRAAKVQASLRSLARTSAARTYKQWVKRNLQTESQIPGLSEWLGMCS